MPASWLKVDDSETILPLRGLMVKKWALLSSVANRELPYRKSNLNRQSVKEDKLRHRDCKQEALRLGAFLNASGLPAGPRYWGLACHF